MKEKEEIERQLEKGKNDHRNPARNRTQDLSLSGQLLYQLSYWAYFFFLFQIFILHSPRVFSNNIFASTPAFPSLEGDSNGLGTQGQQWILLKTWVTWHSFSWRGREWLRDLVGVGSGPVASLVEQSPGKREVPGLIPGWVAVVIFALSGLAFFLLSLSRYLFSTHPKCSPT